MTEKKYTKEQLRQRMCEQLNFISGIADGMQDDLERGRQHGSCSWYRRAPVAN